MFQFQILSPDVPATNTVYVQFEEDHGDVNILLNDELVAYFDGEAGQLCLVPVDKDFVSVPTKEKTGRSYLKVEMVD